MLKERIPDSQGIVLVIIYIAGNTFIYGLGARAGSDLWLAFLLGIVLSLPMLLLYARIRSFMPGQSFGQALNLVLGTWPARALALAYGGYAWQIATLAVIDITSFIQAITLPGTPTLVTASCLVALALWGAKEGVEVLARWCSVVIKLMAPMVIVILLLLLTQVDLGEFRPILYNGYKPVLLGAFEVLDFPLLETILLLWAFDIFSSETSPYKVFITGTVIAGFVLFVIASTALAVIGTEMYELNYFPIFLAIARINLWQFLTRLEIVVGVSITVGSFVKTTVCLVAACRALAHGLGFTDYRFLVTPVALSLIPASKWLIKDAMSLEKSATKTVGPTDFTFQVVLPILLWIVFELRKKQLKNVRGSLQGQPRKSAGEAK